MAIVSWVELTSIEQLPVGLFLSPWHKVVDINRGATHLLMRATGTWSAIPGVLEPCGPNGHAGFVLPSDRVVLADAPLGALIGRIGGSAASLQPDGVFAIGTDCVIPMPADSVGPLFVSFNIASRPIDVRAFTISVYSASL
jgi:hypothetical protein